MTERTEPVLFVMIRKLDAAGHDIAIDAYGKTFMAGSASDLKPVRNKKTGWVLRHDGKLENALRQGVLFWTPDEGYPNKKTSNFSGSFDLESPIDEHYTIKKVNDVWTILDRQEATTEEVVEEEKTEEHHEDAEFLLKLAAKKMVAAGLETELKSMGMKGPYLQTKYAGFSITTSYDPKPDGTKLYNVWFRNGTRTGAVTRFSTVDQVIKDIL